MFGDVLKKTNPFEDPLNIIDPGGIGRGILDKLAGDGGPELPAPDVDPQTKQLIDRQNKIALRSNSERLDQAMSGVDSGERFGLLQKDLSDRNAALGGPQIMQDALTKRAQKGYSRDYANIRRQTEIEVPKQRFADLENAHALNVDMQRIQYDRVMRAKKQAADREAARNQVIGSILGTVGTVAGAVIGGPAGAVVGGTAGSIAGQAVAQNGNSQTGTSSGGAYGLG